MNSARLEKKEKKKSANNAIARNGELSNQQRAILKSEAHHLKPTVLIGQDGLTPSVLKEVDLHLELHELIKIKIAGEQRNLREQIAHSIIHDLQAALVQHIGKTLILYRPKNTHTKTNSSENDDLAKIAQAAKSAKTIQRGSAGGPREVKIRKVTRGTRRNPLKTHVVLSNQRITQGGLVKKGKKRQASLKKQILGE